MAWTCFDRQTADHKQITLKIKTRKKKKQTKLGDFNSLQTSACTDARAQVEGEKNNRFIVTYEQAASPLQPTIK